MNKIKLVWEFRGAESEQIAEHHAKHIQEFVHFHHKNNVVKVDKIDDSFAKVTLQIETQDMTFFRDALKPHYGEEV